MEDSLKKVIKILLTILIIVMAVKFFIYALPFIIVLLLGYLVYKKVNNETHKLNFRLHYILSVLPIPKE